MYNPDIKIFQNTMVNREDVSGDEFVAALEKFSMICDSRKEAQARRAQAEQEVCESLDEQLTGLLNRIDKLEKQMSKLYNPLDDDDPKDTDDNMSDPFITIGLGVFFAPIIYKGVSWIAILLGLVSWDASILCYTIGLMLILFVSSNSIFRRICKWLDNK